MKQVKKAPTVGMVSLGCPKALVDSERIMTQLRSEGYDFSATHDGADVVIVNTCGFLDSAKEESLAAIGDALKENGKVIVTGCMGAEPESITKIHPKVMAVTGPQQYEDVVGAVHDVVAPVHDPYVDLVPEAGLKLTPRHYAYLKISEGCNNRCTFCIIPSLRGDLVSRPVGDVLLEAENLVRAGVQELLVISQDTSAYGLDLGYAESTWRGRPVKARLTELCRELGLAAHELVPGRRRAARGRAALVARGGDGDAVGRHAADAGQLGRGRADEEAGVGEVPVCYFGHGSFPRAHHCRFSMTVIWTGFVGVPIWLMMPRPPHTRK